MDTLASIRNITGPEFTSRFNEYRYAQINGAAAPSYSSAQAMKPLEETFEQTAQPVAVS
jgi:HAE1 family hydrophobic/amphiphilic exporter-1